MLKVEKKVMGLLLFVIGVLLCICGLYIMANITGLIGQVGVLLLIIGIILCWGIIYGIYQDYKVRKKKNEL
ncbi:MAG: hypothetical protein ACFFCG_06460 [Promethearchaeota archaeon]